MKLESGKVYLLDTRSSKIYPYEALLAQMSYMRRFVAGEKSETEANAGTGPQPPHPELTPQERAAHWDNLARMSKENREKEASIAKSTPQPEPKKKYKLTEKAGDTPYKAFIDKGWTNKMLIEQGYLEEVSE